MPGKARTAGRVVTYRPSPFLCQRTTLVIKHGELGSTAPSKAVWPPQENIKGLHKSEPRTFSTLFCSSDLKRISTNWEKKSPTQLWIPPGHAGDGSIQKGRDGERRKEGMESPENEGMKSPESEGRESPENEGMESPESKGTESSESEGTESPENEGTESPENEGMESPESEGTESPESEGTESPESEGMEHLEASQAAGGMLRCPKADTGGVRLMLLSSHHQSIFCGSRTYNRMWRDAQKDLDILLQREKNEFLQPEKDRVEVFDMLATSYIKYLQILRNLEEAHYQLVNQQKQALIRQVLDGVIGRILEIKREMVNLEHSEFHYFIDLLIYLELLPQDLEIPIPRYFIKENLETLQQREKMLDEILLNTGLQTQTPVRAMTVEEAVKAIQIAERARQGRCRMAYMRKIYLKMERRLAKRQGQMGPNPNDAAVSIQKAWRGYSQRKKTQKMREEEMIFLGMSSPSHLPAKSISQMYIKETDALQKKVREIREEVFNKDKLRETEGIYIKETLQHQISQWLIECRHLTGRFPDYPTKKKGGSIALLSEKTPEQIAAELEEKKKMELQEKAKKGEKGKEAEKEKMKGKKPEKKVKKEEEEGWKMAPSNFLSILEEEIRQYKAIWQNRDERWDFIQDHPEVFEDEEREKVEEEIRVQVDELMEEKVKNLKLAVDGEKSSKQKKGGKSQKKEKILRTKISKSEEDPTPDRAIDSLYRELVEEGLLIKAKKVNLSDYIGECNLAGTSLHRGDLEPASSLAGVRQLIGLYGILPLGSQVVHEKGPLVKALLLAGPTGVGKKMLVHAICTETGANLFNLSASNIAGKYPEASDLQLMLHKVLKVAKQLQPSVVWIGETEQIFSKAAGDEEMSPKRLEKILPEFLKALKAKDRVLLVGTTNRPFSANLKPLCRVYQKIILIPRPDYRSRYVLWKHIIWQHGGEITDSLDLSALTKVSDGFTQGDIIQAVQTVLSELRLLQMKRKPLRASEFIGPLAKQDPVYREEDDAFQAWYAKTPLIKARMKALAKSKKGEKGKKPRK
ncbi:dynein regulatory complex protein 11 [Phaenicophaeus curvirostris]|uniref:dynein regulatory complex protein 11 n=1 Tax=Phaenicophaeus curvirostris TaxID=33595 RepID=UPI0037F09834